ncbi:hypothetical protein BKA65DRAFT_479685 [Rhexocercosporidium sp. MPI-PUGE-AT-0058]|nr:hypothetical protein BKA65DRAFT_479685 [Rhexocercosporidium sp. MPI-PUGE-AT-0058]
MWHLITALLHLSIAAPAPTPAVEALASATAAIDWVPIDWEGRIIYINGALMVDISLDPRKVAGRALVKRLSPDNCSASTFDPHPRPHSTVADCTVIRDYTPDAHGLWYYGSCVFEAGQPTVFNVAKGSTDVGDVTRNAINIRQSFVLTAAFGSMPCSRVDGGAETFY